MQDQKLPVSSQLQNPLLLEPKKTQTTSISSNYKPLKSFKALGLIASISSLGAAVSFSQPAQAKASISSINGQTLIAELPSLDTSTTKVNQQSTLIGNVVLEQPASTILIQPNLNQEITTQEIPQLPSLEIAQIDKEKAAKKIHTVKPGDTIAGIARQYGLSSNQIIEANNLTNPNFLKINHQLVIPNLELAQENSYQRINLSSDRKLTPLQQKREFYLDDSFVISNPIKPASISSLAEKKAESRQKKRALDSIVTNPTEPEEQTPNQIVSQDSNSYISRLRQDIIQLRTKYQNQNNSGATTAVTPTTEPNEQAVVKEASEVIIPVPKPVSTNIFEENSTVTNNSTPQNQSLASAPTPAENFNTVGISETTTVTPDLPPLSSPEEYLPDNPVFDGYMWPAQGTLTSGYGLRWGRMHKGIDIAAPIGTPIMAAASGEVIFAGWNSGGFGNLVKLRHPNGSVTLYAHNNRVLVSNGQRVRQGQLIAEMGTTGRSTGPHLHFEIRPNGTNAINPIAYLPQTR